MTQHPDDARARAAEEIATAKVLGQELFTAQAKMLGTLSGGEGNINAQILHALSLLSLQANTLTAALTELVGTDAVDAADAAIKTRRDNTDADGSGPGFDAVSVYNSLAVNGPILRKFRNMASRLTVTIDGKTIMWGCPDPLLGKAIQEVFERHLGNGETLFLGDHAETPQGDSQAVFEIPPTATLDWEHDSTSADAISAVAAQVEDHVQRYGGVILDRDGNIVEQRPETL